MAAPSDNGGDDVAPGAIEEQLQRLITHPSFAQAPKLVRLLEHVVRHSLSGDLRELKEYALGVDVFNRGRSFDPRADNIVRAHARRLRQRLEAYYGSDGRTDQIVIELPKGHYVVRISINRAPSLNEPAKKTAPVVCVRPLDHDDFDRDLTTFAELATEEILDNLTRIRPLDTSFDVEGDANYELAGSVRRSNGAIGIAVRVTTRPEGSVLWTQSFEQPDAQHGFVKAPLVAHMVETVVDTDQSCRSMTQVDPLARREYANGQIEWWRWALGAGGNAVVAAEHWRAAIRLEPKLWPAHMQLVICLANRLDPGRTLAESIAETHAAARELLALRQYERLFSRPVAWPFPIAIVNQRLDLDYELAERNFLLAKQQGWPVGQIHGELGSVYAAAGRLSDAMRCFELAIATGSDLNQTWNLFMLGRLQVIAGHCRTAQQSFEGALRMTQAGTAQHLYAHLELVTALHALEQRRHAEKVLRVAWADHGERHSQWFAPAFALLGMAERATQILDAMERRHNEGALQDYYPAFAGHALLGEFDSAFVWLDRVIDNREVFAFVQVRHAPYLEPLRADARFRRAMARLDAIEAQGSPLRPLIEEALCSR